MGSSSIAQGDQLSDDLEGWDREDERETQEGGDIWGHMYAYGCFTLLYNRN